MSIHLFRRDTHQATTPAEIPEPRALLAPVDERIAQLEAAFRYVHVTVDTHFVPEDCEWCDGQGTTAVRVYGDDDHDEHVQSPLELEAVCQRCALKPHGPIWQAGYESRTDRDIRIEVCG